MKLINKFTLILSIIRKYEIVKALVSLSTWITISNCLERKRFNVRNAKDVKAQLVTFMAFSTMQLIAAKKKKNDLKTTELFKIFDFNRL